MLFIFCLLVYLGSIVLAVRVTQKADMTKVLRIREKILALVWFACFIASQFIMIAQVFEWLNIF